MKFERKRGGFTISLGTGIQDKLNSKTEGIRKDFDKWKEVLEFMDRSTQAGDRIAEQWVQEIAVEMEKTGNNMVKALFLPKKMFTEKNRVAVNAAIERSFHMKEYISVTEWNNRTFNLTTL